MEVNFFVAFTLSLLIELKLYSDIKVESELYSITNLGSVKTHCMNNTGDIAFVALDNSLYLYSQNKQIKKIEIPLTYNKIKVYDINDLGDIVGIVKTEENIKVTFVIYHDKGFVSLNDQFLKKWNFEGLRYFYLQCQTGNSKKIINNKGQATGIIRLLEDVIFDFGENRPVKYEYKDYATFVYDPITGFKAINEDVYSTCYHYQLYPISILDSGDILLSTYFEEEIEYDYFIVNQPVCKDYIILYLSETNEYKNIPYQINNFIKPKNFNCNQLGKIFDIKYETPEVDEDLSDECRTRYTYDIEHGTQVLLQCYGIYRNCFSKGINDKNQIIGRFSNNDVKYNLEETQPFFLDNDGNLEFIEGNGDPIFLNNKEEILIIRKENNDWYPSLYYWNNQNKVCVKIEITDGSKDYNISRIESFNDQGYILLKVKSHLSKPELLLLTPKNKE